MRFFLIFIYLLTFNSFSQTKITDVDKIAAWTKTWGILKFFHPGVNQASFDWDQVYLTQLDSIEYIDSKEKLNSHFLKLITNLAPIETSNDNKFDQYPYDDILINFKNDDFFSPQLQEIFTDIVRNYNGNNNKFVKYDNNLGFPIFFEDNDFYEGRPIDRKLRLLSLARIWNTIDFFYPFKIERIKKWNEVLKKQIPIFESADDSLKYFKAISETINKLNDSHSSTLGYTKSDHPLGNKFMPYIFMFVDNELVLLGEYTIKEDQLINHNSIKYTDIIKSIDGIEISKLVIENSKYISGSHYDSKLKFIASNLSRGKEEFARIVVQRDGQLKELTIKRYDRSNIGDLKSRRHDRTTQFELFNEQIGYINLEKIHKDTFDLAFNKFKNKEAIILDFRNGVSFDLDYDFFDNYFSTAPKQFMNYRYADKEMPGMFKLSPLSTVTVGKKQKIKFKGKLIILINEYVQSAGETRVLAFKTYPNITVIGSPTAGTNGEITLIKLPGGIIFRMTSAKITFLDDTPSVGNGIQPDIFIKPTIKGIFFNVDEVLEEAINYGKN